MLISEFSCRSNKKGDLRGLSVFVASSHMKFQEEWSLILKLAGCQVLPKLPPIYSGESTWNFRLMFKLCAFIYEHIQNLA